jgi:hypothetical protein
VYAAANTLSLRLMLLHPSKARALCPPLRASRPAPDALYLWLILSLPFYGMGNNPGRMTVKRMYLVLLAAATVGGCVLHLLDAGAAGFSSPIGIASGVGKAVGLFLMAALVSRIIVLFHRKPIGSASSPTAVGLVVMTALVLLSYQGIEVQRTLAFVPFEAPGCTFSASFPGPPEVKELVVAGGIAVTQANFYGSDTVLRAECLPTEGRFAPTRETVMAELRGHAHRNGLINVEFELSETNEFVRGIARGSKTSLETRPRTRCTSWWTVPP